MTAVPERLRTSTSSTLQEAYSLEANASLTACGSIPRDELNSVIYHFPEKSNHAAFLPEPEEDMPFTGRQSPKVATKYDCLEDHCTSSAPGYISSNADNTLCGTSSSPPAGFFSQPAAKSNAVTDNAKITFLIIAVFCSKSINTVIQYNRGKNIPEI